MTEPSAFISEVANELSTWPGVGSNAGRMARRSSATVTPNLGCSTPSVASRRFTFSAQSTTS